MEKRDINTITELMCNSFKEDPLYTYFVPECEARLKFLRDFMKFRLKYGMKYGEVYVTKDCKGVVIWLPPNCEMKFKDVVMLGGFTAMLKCGSKAMKRIMDFNNYADKITGEVISDPHWHISPIAVSPEYQGRGYAKELILHKLSQIDQKCQLCSLETQSEKNETIYKKYGFETASITNIPDTQIRHIAMIRSAKK